jgi:hypothetical protein
MGTVATISLIQIIMAMASLTQIQITQMDTITGMVIRILTMDMVIQIEDTAVDTTNMVNPTLLNHQSLLFRHGLSLLHHPYS